MHIVSLHTYPIKSCRGIDHQSVMVEPRGLRGDRRWMIIDGENHFITQREMASFATMSVNDHDAGITIEAGGEKLSVSTPTGDERANVMVWGDLVFAAVAEEATNKALSDMLGKNVRLAFMDDKAVRKADPDIAPAGSEVSFADGFPILITSEKSLAAVNDLILEQGGETVGMERFRPNIVVDGLEAWEEDSWDTLQIGDIVFDVLTPCPRCVVTTQDQKTGAKNDDNQPIRALTKLRRSGSSREPGVLFGWNLNARAVGTISTGDKVEVLSKRQAWPIL